MLLPVPDEPAEVPPDEAVTQLNEGLKVCQKVVSEYRAALSQNQPVNDVEDAKPDRRD